MHLKRYFIFPKTLYKDNYSSQFSEIIAYLTGKARKVFQIYTFKMKTILPYIEKTTRYFTNSKIICCSQNLNSMRESTLMKVRREKK